MVQLSQTWKGLLRQALQAGVRWQLQHCQATDVPSLLALAVAAAVVAAVGEEEAVVALDDGASEGNLGAVTIVEMGEGVADRRGVPGICYPNVTAGGDASSLQVQDAPAEVGPSQGVAVLVKCPWGPGVEDGLAVEGRTLVGASCQEVDELALLVGVLGAACRGEALLEDHWAAPLVENLCPLAAQKAYAVDAADQHVLLVGDQASEILVNFDHEVRTSVR